MYAHFHTVGEHLSGADSGERVCLVPVDDLAELEPGPLHDPVEEGHIVISAPHIAACPVLAHPVHFPDHLFHEAEIFLFGCKAVKLELSDHILVVLQSGEISRPVLIVRRVGEHKIHNTVRYPSESRKAVFLIYDIDIHRNISIQSSGFRALRMHVGRHPLHKISKSGMKNNIVFL